MDIIRQLELFQQKRVPYLRNYVLNPPNNHHTIIDQWARWWIEDTNESNVKRGVFDEAIACKGGKGGRRADIMFLEQSPDKIFEIKGVAEIENNIRDNADKYLEKLETLKIYDEMTDKFPNLDFVVLSTIMVGDKNNTYLDFFSPLLKEAKKYSKDSDLSWIIYALIVFENHKTPREFKVPNYIDGYETFVRYYEYHNQAAYVILHEGKEIKKKIGLNSLV